MHKTKFLAPMTFCPVTFLNGPFMASFSLFSCFQYSGQYTGKCSLKIADDEITTADIWCQT